MVISHLPRASSVLSILCSGLPRRMERKEVELSASGGDPVSAGRGELQRRQVAWKGNCDEVARIRQQTEDIEDPSEISF